MHTSFHVSFIVYSTGQIDLIGIMYLGSVKLESYAGQTDNFENPVLYLFCAVDIIQIIFVSS
jgi:hypothetical protein